MQHIEAEGSSEMLVNTYYQVTWHHTLEDGKNLVYKLYCTTIWENLVCMCRAFGSESPQDTVVYS